MSASDLAFSAATPTSLVLSARDAGRIAADAADADRAGWLAPRQQALLHQRGWLRMLAPRAAGGLEAALPDVVRLEEALARVDGSMAWVLTLCAGAGWFAGFMPPAVARSIVGSRRVCVAGSGAPTGFADVDAEDAAGAPLRYRIDGRWDYASGAPMATHFTLNAVLRRHGEVLRDDAGAPRIRAFIVPRAVVTLQPSWRSMGLRASASHAYTLTAAEVAADCGFRIDASAASAPGPLYRFPFMALAYVTLAVNLAGMAAHFLALASVAIGRRRLPASTLPLSQLPSVAARLQHAERALGGARGVLYDRLDAAWQRVADGAALSAADNAGLRAAALALVETARDGVDQIYPYCGLAAAASDTPLNRVWRDFHTATQHTLLLPES